MAIANSDGSIILSTKVDTSGIDSFFKKYSVGLGDTTTKTKQNTQSKKENIKETEKQQNAYEKLKAKIKEQTVALQKMKAEYSSIILTEGKTSEAAQTLSSKMATLSGNLEENKAKLAGVEQEANDLVSSFSKVGNEAQESAEKPKNAYQQLEETIAEQKTRLEELRQEYASLKLTNQGNTTQAKKLKAEINNLSAEVVENEARIKSLGLTASSAFSRMKSGLMALASYFIGIQTILAVFRFSKEAGQLATQTETSAQRLVDIYGEASESVGKFIDQNSKAIGLSKTAGASIAQTYGNLLSVWADQETNAELTNALLNQTAVVASKTGRTTEDVAERIRSGLLGNTEAIEDLGINVNIKTIEITDAFKRIADGRSWEQLNAYEQAQVRTLSILEQSTNKYGNEVTETTAIVRNRYRAAYEDFKNSWGYVVNGILIPVLKTLTQIFDVATRGLNVLSGRSGSVLDNIQNQEKNTEKTAKNIEAQKEAQKDLNKEMNKTLAGFDEIEILSQNASDSSEAGSGAESLETYALTGGLENIAPDGSAYVEEANAMLTAIMGFVSVAMVAIGVILLLTGHIGWGLGFIISGAGLLSVTQASVLQKGIGIDVQNALTTALLIAGVAAIVIGIILCMCKKPVKGIALIALGAVTVVGDIAINWNSIKDMLSNEKVATWVAIGGILAVVLGILLCFAHQWLPGIGLIALGATALGVDIAVNWDAIGQWIQGAFEKIKSWIATYGGLVLGILLLFSGVGTAFGLALIVDSVSSLGKGQKPALWDSLLNSVKQTWANIKAYWNENIANIWTFGFWIGLAKIAGNGLIDGFELATNGIIGLFEKMINWIVDGLNKISFDIPDWLGGGTFGFNIPNVKLGRLSIPRLAQGAVIPGGREFLAVLGDQPKGQTNIEAPLQTIVDAFNIALSQDGNTGSGNTEVVLEVDGREFGRAVVEQGNKENRRIGTKLVIA